MCQTTESALVCQSYILCTCFKNRNDATLARHIHISPAHMLYAADWIAYFWASERFTDRIYQTFETHQFYNKRSHKICSRSNRWKSFVFFFASHWLRFSKQAASIPISYSWANNQIEPSSNRICYYGNAISTMHKSTPHIWRRRESYTLRQFADLRMKS